jgi:hypothetical protein
MLPVVDGVLEEAAGLTKFIMLALNTRQPAKVELGIADMLPGTGSSWSEVEALRGLSSWKAQARPMSTIMGRQMTEPGRTGCQGR